ncbi:MAG: glycerol-3-phosphate 1-O-acyltransferase PlsY [Dongiaceae bacterium]
MPETIGFATAMIATLLGYLLGSIPFGLLLTRAAGLGDIRKIGSGNIGATNVLRTGNQPLAAATLLLDAAKGAAAVLIARHWGNEAALLAGGGAMLGHLYPVWLKFRGGKGVATSIGILLAICWPVGILACLVWLATAAVFRYSSLAALVAITTAPIAAWFAAGTSVALLALFLAALVWLRHRANVDRLLKGTEPRIGKGKADAH